MFADNLKKLRNTHGLTQVEFAKKFNISAGTIAMWETGKRIPDISMIKKIADYFKVPVDSLINEYIKLDFVPHEFDENTYALKCPTCDYNYTHFIRTKPIDFESKKSDGIALEFYCESGHTFYLVIESYKGNTYMVITDESCKVANAVDYVYESAPVPLSEFWDSYEFNNKKYRTLDEYGKQAVDSILNIEYDRCTYIEEPEDDEEPTFEICFSELPVSAGTGEFLSEEMTSVIEIPDTPFNRTADFVVQVSGRSMEPEFYEDDLLLVRKQPSVYEGEIGIFVKNGCGYVKKFGGDRLISINPDYDDIDFGEYDTVVCYGKVIGKV